MESFRTIPILGLKTSVPQNDITLLRPAGDGVALAHCVDGENIDFQRVRNACSKSRGKLLWSNTANAQHTRCLGLFELIAGANTDHIYFDNGKVYIYDGSRDPVDRSGAVTFANGAYDFYSAIRYGNYMVFADRGEHTPYCWDNGDATVSKLISAGTEFTFRFLENFQRRIIGAYSDQTNGDIEIRWCDALDVPITGCEFHAANQLYQPDDDPISGIKRIGSNACVLYSRNNIARIDYYPNYSSPFGIITTVSGQGSVNHHSIVNAGGRHFIFNKNYGFCEYRGGIEFPFGGKPISEDIEDLIATISAADFESIVGCFIPRKGEAVWTVPFSGGNKLLFYNIITGTWRIEDKAMRYVDYWTVSTDITWTKLTTTMGYTTWESLGNIRWSDLSTEFPRLVFSNADGQLYYHSGESDAGSALDGYRTEPMLDFGRPFDRDHLKEIWFGLAAKGSYNIHCYYRGGDTEAECQAASWETLDDLSCDSPDNAVIYLSKNHKLHQIKWGTDAANEPFVVNDITYKYDQQGTPY